MLQWTGTCPLGDKLRLLSKGQPFARALWCTRHFSIPNPHATLKKKSQQFSGEESKWLSVVFSGVSSANTLLCNTLALSHRRVFLVGLLNWPQTINNINVKAKSLPQKIMTLYIYISSQEENHPQPPKIKKFIWTSFSEQFPLGSWLVSWGRRQKFARTFRKSSRKRSVFWYFGILGVRLWLYIYIKFMRVGPQDLLPY